MKDRPYKTRPSLCILHLITPVITRCTLKKTGMLPAFCLCPNHMYDSDDLS